MAFNIADNLLQDGFSSAADCPLVAHTKSVTGTPPDMSKFPKSSRSSVSSSPRESDGSEYKRYPSDYRPAPAHPAPSNEQAVPPSKMRVARAMGWTK